MPTATSPRLSLGLLSACIVAECTYVASFAPFPTSDAAAHIASASALRDFVWGSSPIARAALEWRLLPPAPNLVPGLALAAVSGWLGEERAEVLLILGYVAGLALALYRAIRQIGPGAEALAFFALPFTFSLSLLYGFFNFCWSLVLLLLFAGRVLREPYRLDWKRALELSTWLLVLYCTHLVGWLIAGVLLGCLALARCLCEGKGLPLLAASGLVLAPTALLAFWFLSSTGSAPITVLIRPWSKAIRILALEYGHSAYARAEVLGFVAAGLLFWTLLFAALWRGRARALREPRRLGLILTLLFAGALAVLGPEGTESGAALLSPRLAAIVALLGVLLVASLGELRRRAAIAVMMLCPAAALWVGAVRQDTLRSVEQRQRALLELAPRIEPHRTLLQANLGVSSLGDMDRIYPLTAEAGRLAARRHALDLGNVDLALPYFPLRFRDATNPYVWMVAAGHTNEDVPPPLDLFGYEKQSGIQIDYVILAGRAVAEPAVLSSPAWHAFAAQLDRGFTQVAASGGFWELWERR